ncbi:MAG: hypothetical protein KDC38_04635 [Planctomycetes bacterium]|nr:hypothetical protein [Planctomycetota bacterium]
MPMVFGVVACAWGSHLDAQSFAPNWRSERAWGVASAPLASPFRTTALAASMSEDSMDDAKCPYEPWPGFGTGLRDGFERLPRPVDSPLYFEDPFINTDLRPLVLYHEFPKDSLLGGGDLTVLAVQARLALTDRLQFIATSDGHSDLESSALPEGEGWNDLAAGLKFALYVEKETKTILSAGARWKLSNGSRAVFQGIEDEISLFLSGARSFGKVNVIGHAGGRITTHHNQGNDSLSWDVHVNYELTRYFHPIVEYHGFYYLSNGNRLQVRDGLLDYGNLGAGDVAGSSAHWGSVGARWEMKPGVSLGCVYSFALRRESNNDIFKRRVMTNLVIAW